MNIYFGASVRGGRDDAQFYHDLVELLKTKGKVLTEHLGSLTLTSDGEKNITSKEVYERDIDWLESADVLIAEVTHASLGVGMELMYAVHKRIPVLCLYRDVPGKKMSRMVLGCDGIVSKVYKDLAQAQKHIDEFLLD